MRSLNTCITIYQAAFSCFGYLDLLRDIFLQFLSVTNDTDKLAAARKIKKYVHGIIYGFSVQCSESFINKQRIDLYSSDIGGDCI